ncbi:programmed cell death protein 2 [Blyttiomyces helicus]|uniref:Programmed cell death protein 2 n=1 Tax=Blyttiomyces helicus TaxID=388810 RepID=A0A4P9WES0_9FUNG|nr:programmed cell death protein 2 [Blyttiomyces helicus]|eukprot:RKO91104.1 programmed cell death protein 2 [Blyttiomyces helicus]
MASSNSSAASQVQLGYPCEEMDPSFDTDPYLDKIGGSPVWFDRAVLPPAHCAACESCGAPLYLVSQILAQRPGAPHDRVFYVLGCNSRRCTAASGRPYTPKPKRGPKSKPAAATPQAPVTPAATGSGADVSGQPAKGKKKGAKYVHGKPARSAPNVMWKPDTVETIGAVVNVLEESAPDTLTGFGAPASVGPPAFGAPVFGAPAFGGTPAFGVPSFGGAPAFGAPSFGGAPAFSGPPASCGAPAFGAPTTFGSPAFGVPSPASSSSPSTPPPSTPDSRDDIEYLLALRDKKYAWFEESDDEPAPAEVPVSTPVKAPAKQLNVRAPEYIPTSASASPSLEEMMESKLKITEDAVVPDTPLQATWKALPVFPPTPLEFAPEPEEVESYDYEMRLFEKYKRAERAASGGGGDDDESGEAGWAAEGYEKMRIKGVSKTFKKFQKVVQEEPEQCIRYAPHTTPIFYTTDPISDTLSKTGPPPCPRCTGPRSFEFQLMPKVLSLLPTEEHARSKNSHKMQNPSDAVSFFDRFAVGMDWGTVMVYSCANDCEGSAAGVTYCEEHVAVQVESLV